MIRGTGRIFKIKASFVEVKDGRGGAVIAFTRIADTGDRLPVPPHFPNRVATSGEYRFEFAFIRSHSRDAFQNVSTHGFVVPAACLQVIASVLGSVKTHLPVLCGLAGGPGEDGAVLLDIAILSLPR
jgi:hypothetical protein